MTGVDEQLVGRVDEQFAVESHFLSTRSADAYRAVNHRLGSTVVLWVLRHPLARNSDAVRRFMGRMKSIQERGEGVSELRSFGIDGEGTAFAVFPNFDGQPVVSSGGDARENERRFMACLRTVEALHSAGIVCGDLCGQSFIVNRSGELRFVGVMGSFDSEAAATAMLPPVETLQYMAPEQRMGGGLERASDVYALGVLGYMLVVGKPPFPQSSAMTGAPPSMKIPLPSELKPDAPLWANDVLPRALAYQANGRFQTVAEMLEAIQGARSSSSALARRDSAARPPVVPTASERPHPDGEWKEKRGSGRGIRPSPAPARGISLRWLFVLGVMALVVVGLLVVLVRQRQGGKSGVPSVLDIHRQVAGSEELQNAISVLERRDTELSERLAMLERVVRSDDPLAHDILVRSAMEAQSLEERTLAERAALDRARRLGLMRTAEQVRSWLNTIRGSRDVPAGYEGLLRVLDVSLPTEARSTLLRRGYAASPRAALRIAAAIALDLEDFGGIRDTLAQLLGDSLHMVGLEQYSPLTLIMATPDLGREFAADVIQRRAEIPDHDLPWLLEQLADRNDVNVRAVANLMLDRGLTSPLRRVFIATLRDRGDLPADVVRSLVKAVAGRLGPEDIAPFGRWFDIVVEKVLFAVCAEALRPDVVIEAFDTVAARTISVEPSGALIEWVRQHAWANRGDLAQAIGIFAFADILGEAEVTKALEAFETVAQDREFLEILIATENPVIVRLAVRRFGKLVRTGRLLSLLGHREKEIRRVALEALQETNDIGALKMIIDAYEREKDEELREVYRQKFWMIRQREEAPKRLPGSAE